MITSPSWTSYLSSWLWENDPVTSDVDMNYSFLKLTITIWNGKGKNSTNFGSILSLLFRILLNSIYTLRILFSYG